jgi:hypothetical protein
MAGKAWIEGTGHRLPSETVILNRKPGQQVTKSLQRAFKKCLSRSAGATLVLIAVDY